MAFDASGTFHIKRQLLATCCRMLFHVKHDRITIIPPRTLGHMTPVRLTVIGSARSPPTPTAHPDAALPHQPGIPPPIHTTSLITSIQSWSSLFISTTLSSQLHPSPKQVCRPTQGPTETAAVVSRCPLLPSTPPYAPPPTPCDPARRSSTDSLAPVRPHRHPAPSPVARSTPPHP